MPCCVMRDVLGSGGDCCSRAIYLGKGHKKSEWFFQVDVSSKKRTNEFYFTAMKPQVDLFSLVFWRKLKTPKRHFEINWPLGQKKNHWFSGYGETPQFPLEIYWPLVCSWQGLMALSTIVGKLEIHTYYSCISWRWGSNFCT